MIHYNSAMVNNLPTEPFWTPTSGFLATGTVAVVDSE